MMDSSPWTIARVLDWTRGFFESKGIETARLDAELLIAHALKLKRIALYLDYHRPLSAQELDDIRGLVRRRSKLEPIHYILGQREFWSISLSVDSRVLIPRPDTERLVELVLDTINNETEHVLDLCTGSGAIALAIASEHPTLNITATDISADALTLAQENSADLKLLNIQFKVSNLFQHITGTFDIIVSNPPYISSGECEKLMPDVREYEPMLALDGGVDGLSFYRLIIEQCPSYLSEQGHVFMEIGYDQAEDIKTLIEQSHSLIWKNCYQDLSGNDRVIHAQRK